ncbi:FAD-dependent 5-carboxymethylaminomethyl-2-thiouridine(34) oxidoreductase MnmC [Salinicola rhizosphaerae]|uniref:tRNA 5-methylaminomethyl-2-thiouridine biosynthesis bifunctional protein MnmC n=1 Tax=Salinicola rhizosphaerae TaxID=1443141 RepID=A0ABQ3DYW8_9GAMM|nr:FAD-dependent 5-carboxymethylaminomethyl-2-thiouridine(34) oxidoreductase MnmC [Salinicola rhizosphaerae]GHB20779.1 tRNA 5-methylaminomethyl-2-thiouridine biosynthesis bifunctional protein MnmC [Salinicola rhizosphaerae]
MANHSANTPRHSAAEAALSPAELDWRSDDNANEAPYSTHYDDVYFSRQDGLEETHFVFLEHNALASRLADWSRERAFVIGETGFGTGLNMLCAWACFDENAPSAARLHLVSTEKHPLTREALERVWHGWPTLVDRARALIDQWPPAVAGIHRLALSERVTLDLHFGDAAESLARLDGAVDAWFLDGFAPSKNPDMWQPPLFEALARASRPGATFATFTCAGLVRRGLAAAGFSWQKVPGFGRKREMLQGVWRGNGLAEARASQPNGESEPGSDALSEALHPRADAESAAATVAARAETPWFHPPAPRRRRHIAVIGAGIAGASVAAALARRGSEVTVIDRAGVAGGASGNPQAALYVKLALETNLQSRFYLAALLHTQRWLARLDPERRWWHDCGLLQWAGDRNRRDRFLANHSLPETVVHAQDDALRYPGAGWVDPVALCRTLLEPPGIEWRRDELHSLRETENGWRLQLSGHALTVDQVVFATGHASRDWLDGLPLQAIRGQISTLSVSPALTLDEVHCAGGYVMPPRKGQLTFGATFTPNDDSNELRLADHRRNLSELSRTAPALGAALGEIPAESLGGRASVRAASPDKTPYAGPLPDARAWRQAYAALSKDANRRFDTPGVHYPGLWVSTAHGSRGMVSAPLCAEVIASRIHDEPLPLPRELVDHLHPGRRIIAGLRRGR